MTVAGFPDLGGLGSIAGAGGSAPSPPPPPPDLGGLGTITGPGGGPPQTPTQPTTTTGGTPPGGGGTPKLPQGDYTSLLAIYGLPPDVQAKVNEIFAQSTDIMIATALALAYVRGTTWYAQTYPGIQEGIAKGIVGNEADYRSYLTQLNQLTTQYFGRSVGGDELAGYLKQGFTVGHVGQLFQGQAYVTANRPNIQYVSGAFGDNGPLSGDELTALGNESAGLDSPIGQRVQQRLQQAQQRLQAVFSGQLATPSLSIGSNGLTAPSLAGRGASPDVAA